MFYIFASEKIHATMDTPFIYDRYVTGKNFIGRKAECHALENLLRSGNNVVIYDQPKSGKMSVIQQTFFNMRLTGRQFAVAQIRLLNTRTVESFLTKLGSEIIRSVASTPDEYKDIIDRHLQGTHFLFDRTRFSEHDELLSLNWDADGNDIAALFRLPKKLSAEKGCDFYIVIEEFQTLLKTADPDMLFSTMEKTFETENAGYSYILTGSMVNAMKYIFEYRKFFYRKIEHLPLSHVDDKDIIEYIVKGFLTSGKVIERDLVLGASRLFRSNMWYINHFIAICDSLSKGYINEGILMEALRIIISLHEPRFMAIMNGLTDHQISLLRAILEGVTRFSSTDVIEKYSLNSSANVRRVKDALMKKEIITFNEREDPVIMDPLFKYWLEKYYMELS